MAAPKHYQNPRRLVDPWRDIPRLLGWLEERARADRAAGQPVRKQFTTSEVNREFYPSYDKKRTYRMQASPALLLLREAMKQGHVRYGTRHGTWIDIRGTWTAGEAWQKAR